MKRLLLATAFATAAIASQAFAADLGTRAPAYTKAPVYAPVSNWTGLYIGGNVGYGWGSVNTDIVVPQVFDTLAPAVGTRNDINGVVGGGQIGYNWQMGSLVSGLEADIQGSGVRGSGSLTGPTFDGGNPVAYSTDTKLSWFGTVRGRIGVTVTPSLLLYGTGGLAYGEVKNSASVVPDEPPFNSAWLGSVSQTKAGWAAGGGAEWMIARGWSAKVEYLHIDLGSASVVAHDVVAADPLTTSFSWRNRFDTVRFGVNYHFN